MDTKSEPDHNRIEAEPQGYTELDDTYRGNQPVQVVETTATGEPQDPSMATTNAYEGGGLPLNPREPYPVGDGPEDAGRIKGRP